MSFKVKDGLVVGNNTVIDGSGNVNVPSKINLGATAGTLERDFWYSGGSLLVRNGSAQNKTIAYTDSNITGTAANVTGIVAVANGGTGASTDSAARTNLSVPGLTTNNTLTGTNTFRAANAIRSEAAATQDAVVVAGRAGGSSSFAVTLTPTTLTASRTLTIPNVTGTIVTTGDTGTVTSTMIEDGTIVDADINANAAIAITKLASSTISGVSLGGNLATLTLNTSGTGLSGSTTYNGSGIATFTVISNATSANTASAIVARDGSGNFSAGTITANLSGTATNSTNARVTTSSTNSAFKVPFANTTVSTTGDYGLLQDDTATFTYNPSTNTLVVGTLSGALDASNLTGTIADARLTGTYSGFSHKLTSGSTVFSATSTGSTDTLGRTVFGLAEYRSSAASQVGALVFIAPNTTSTVMHQFEVNGLLYNQNIVKFMVQGYRTTGAWSDLRKVNLGTVDVQVRWGVTPDGRNCLILGDVGTTWSYPHITITKALFSHTNVSDAYSTGWTVAVVTDLSTYTNVSSTITNSSVASSVTSAGNVTGTVAIANGGTGATDATNARTNLGLGSAATVNTGTSGATIPLLNGTHTWGGANTFSASIAIPTAGSAMELGRTDGNTSSPAIDFHSGATLVDYDSRIVASGGNGTLAGGALQILAASLTLPASVSSSGTITANAFSGPVSGNVTGNLTGNASTATTLATARNINGTSFNGSADITTNSWGTSRTITIGNTGKAVDGSAAVSWSRSEIGAAGTADANVFTAANTFRAANAIRSEAASTQDAVVVAGRAGGTGSFAVTLTPTTLTASQTLTLPNVTGTVVTTGDTGTVTSTMIANGTIVDADINASAAIAITKLAASTISGVSLGNNLATLTRGTYLTGSNYNGSAAQTWAVDADTANTASKVVARDASGNFSAGTITANLTGTATNATNATITTSSANSAFKVPFANTTANTTGNYGLLQDSEGTFTYNPSTNTLAVASLVTSGTTIFSGEFTQQRQALSVVNTNTTLETGRTYVLTSNATLTLPASPTAGNWVRVINRSGTTSPVVARNSQNIMGLAEDIVLDAYDVGVMFMYADASNGWVIT